MKEERRENKQEKRNENDKGKGNTETTKPQEKANSSQILYILSVVKHHVFYSEARQRDMQLPCQKTTTASAQNRLLPWSAFSFILK